MGGKGAQVLLAEVRPNRRLPGGLLVAGVLFSLFLLKKGVWQPMSTEKCANG